MSINFGRDHVIMSDVRYVTYKPVLPNDFESCPLKRIIKSPKNPNSLRVLFHSCVYLVRKMCAEQRDPQISLSYNQSTDLKNLSYNKNTQIKYYLKAGEHRFLGASHNKRNREQKIKFSIYQKLCIPQYMISDRLKFLFSVLCFI